MHFNGHLAILKHTERSSLGLLGGLGGQEKGNVPKNMLWKLSLYYSEMGSIIPACSGHADL
jgi:hypothetical protein